tara:strand:+ start:197 stop:544 length:348 start_codon:yes stop_codon:yes gene_type:complete
MSNFIQWNGTSEDGSVNNYTWNTADFNWGDFQIIAEVSQVISGGGKSAERKKRLEKWLKHEPEKERRLVQLVCRIKNKKVYDEKKISISNATCTVEDVEMVINEMKAILEIKDVL